METWCYQKNWPDFQQSLRENLSCFVPSDALRNRESAVAVVRGCDGRVLEQVSGDVGR